jgi:hypothetical protein
MVLAYPLDYFFLHVDSFYVGEFDLITNQLMLTVFIAFRKGIDAY